MSVNDDIFNAVRSAVRCGMTPRGFVEAAWAEWDNVLREDMEQAQSAFKKMLGKA